MRVQVFNCVHVGMYVHVGAKLFEHVVVYPVFLHSHVGEARALSVEYTSMCCR